VTTAQVKKLFFDRQKIIDAMDRSTRAALSKAGAFVRQRARTSMKRSKKTAEAGKPPRAHAGQIRDLLFFGYDAARRSVVVGPTAFEGSEDDRGMGGAAVQEFGGKVIIPARMVAGKKQPRRVITVKPHPFMGPALEAEAPAFPSYWQSSLHD
jgi:hypothetical protein